MNKILETLEFLKSEKIKYSKYLSKSRFELIRKKQTYNKILSELDTKITNLHLSLNEASQKKDECEKSYNEQINSLQSTVKSLNASPKSSPDNIGKEKQPKGPGKAELQMNSKRIKNLEKRIVYVQEEMAQKLVELEKNRAFYQKEITMTFLNKETKELQFQKEYGSIQDFVNQMELSLKSIDDLMRCKNEQVLQIKEKKKINYQLYLEEKMMFDQNKMYSRPYSFSYYDILERKNVLPHPKIERPVYVLHDANKRMLPDLNDVSGHRIHNLQAYIHDKRR